MKWFSSRSTPTILVDVQVLTNAERKQILNSCDELLSDVLVLKNLETADEIVRHVQERKNAVLNKFLPIFNNFANDKNSTLSCYRGITTLLYAITSVKACLEFGINTVDMIKIMRNIEKCIISAVKNTSKEFSRRNSAFNSMIPDFLVLESRITLSLKSQVDKSTNESTGPIRRVCIFHRARSFMYQQYVDCYEEIIKHRALDMGYSPQHALNTLLCQHCQQNNTMGLGVELKGVVDVIFSKPSVQEKIYIEFVESMFALSVVLLDTE